MASYRLDLYPEDQHCNATLRLNDTVAMSGGQVANITTLDHNSTLYLGNSRDVKDYESKPFIGCIRDLIVRCFDIPILIQTYHTKKNNRLETILFSFSCLLK